MEYVLKMPARSFFAMVAAASKIQANEYAALCDIAAIPSCDEKYHEKLKGFFLSQAEVKDPEPESRFGPPVIDSGSDEAMYLFKSAIAMKKREYGG